MNKMNFNSRMLLIGQALSYMGDYCVLPALLILSTYYEDYWVTSGVIIVRSLPTILQPFLGPLIDRWDRLKIMIWTDIIRGCMFAGIAFLPEGQYASLFLILLLCCYGSGVFFNPARLAVMSSLGDDIKYVNTIFAKATTLFIVAGACVGALFLVSGSVKWAVLFNALTYFASALFLRKMKLPVQVHTAPKANVHTAAASLRAGLHEIIRNPFVLNGVLTMMTMALLWGIMYSYFPVVSHDIGDGEVGNFILTICIGVGGFIGAHLVGRWGFNNTKGLAYFVLLSLVSLSLFTFSGSFWIALIAANGFFIAMEYGEVLAKVKVQEHSSNAMQGRIFAVSEAMIGLFISFGSILINLMHTTWIVIVVALVLTALFVHTSMVNRLHMQQSKQIGV
ncbi:MFS transporter [Paenibacillus campi]|uniref:MFS transporter n=1 Tax=Paenibacillus campi TaxID=3106031 RepID=UPI002B0017A8|nr:MFS transporter [Paenibacillus sp. SGZ-1014]